MTQNGYFFLGDYSYSTGWNQLTLNYLGPNNGEGISLYENGALVTDDKTITPTTLPEGDGRIVLGRRFIDKDDPTASVDLDEILFFNQFLSDSQITELANL